MIKKNKEGKKWLKFDLDTSHHVIDTISLITTFVMNWWVCHKQSIYNTTLLLFIKEFTFPLALSLPFECTFWLYLLWFYSWRIQAVLAIICSRLYCWCLFIISLKVMIWWCLWCLRWLRETLRRRHSVIRNLFLRNWQLRQSRSYYFLDFCDFRLHFYSWLSIISRHVIICWNQFITLLWIHS